MSCPVQGPWQTAFLGFMLYFPTHNEKFGKIFDIYDPDHDIPTYANPVPTAVLPTVASIPVGYNCFLMHSSRQRRQTCLYHQYILRVKNNMRINVSGV
ncbi:hypothetical protein Leryth_013089 [Lithospermum erythrorhizon]|nr:hypothetical protein Leryth_013089 [Lithospermum erythrorhizon]